MAYSLLTAPIYFRIDGGIVFIEASSGCDPINLSMPITQFRTAIAGGQRAIDEFDATHKVVHLLAAGH